MNILPVNLDDLIHAKKVESVRLDFKAGWDKYIREKTVATICAFANDFQGLNGGYVVIGIHEEGGQPILPPTGLDDENIEQIQKEIWGSCNRIIPVYQPILAPELYMGKQILVVYAPMGDARPYQAPATEEGADREYYVRVGANTIVAKGHILTQLLQATARVPFDERKRSDVPLSVLSHRRILKFFQDTGSYLAANDDDSDPIAMLRGLRLLGGTNGTEAPRNATLLFFTEEPHKYLANANVEVAQFRDDAGGELIETRVFNGPLPQQVVDTISYLETTFGVVLSKNSGAVSAKRVVAYPLEALRESIVNAVYHRGYEGTSLTSRVAMYSDRIEITSYPGPVPGVELNHLIQGGQPPPVPPRNPRTGELLRSLRLAETWHTGVARIHRTMKDNGSPTPRFDFDTERTYFRVTLPVHPGYLALNALRDAAVMWHTGERERGISSLRVSLTRVPQAGALAAQLIDYLAATGDIASARHVLTQLEQTPGAYDRHLAYFSLARAYLDSNDRDEASALLSNVPRTEVATVQNIVDLAILQKRSHRYQDAHKAFASVSAVIHDDPKALHEFAQTKIHLARAAGGNIPRARDVARRLRREAIQLLERVVQLATDQHVRAAWAWFDIARVRESLGEPKGQIFDAIGRAIRLLPDEPRFLRWIEQRQKSDNDPNGQSD